MHIIFLYTYITHELPPSFFMKYFWSIHNTAEFGNLFFMSQFVFHLGMERSQHVLKTNKEKKSYFLLLNRKGHKYLVDFHLVSIPAKFYILDWNYLYNFYTYRYIVCLYLVWFTPKYMLSLLFSFSFFRTSYL